MTHGTSIVICTLTPEDAAGFAALRLQGLREVPEAFASSYEEEAHTPIAAVEQRLAARADGAIFGVFNRGTLVGVVGVQREAMAKLAHTALLWGMYVVPAHRRNGVGAALVQHALAYATSDLRVRQRYATVYNAATASWYTCAVFGSPCPSHIKYVIAGTSTIAKSVADGRYRSFRAIVKSTFILVSIFWFLL